MHIYVHTYIHTCIPGLARCKFYFLFENSNYILNGIQSYILEIINVYVTVGIDAFSHFYNILDFWP